MPDRDPCLDGRDRLDAAADALCAVLVLCASAQEDDGIPATRFAQLLMLIHAELERASRLLSEDRPGA